jgi:hypothetical protein
MAAPPQQPRSRVAVVDDIVAELKLDGKLKRGCGDPRPVIDVALQLARVQTGTRKAYWAKQARRDAGRAKKALAVLGRDYFDQIVIGRLEYVARRAIPEERIDRLQDFCGSSAVYLVSEFSRKRPTGTPAGVVHSIAGFIFKSATGQWPTKASLLKAGRRALKTHCEGPQS